MIDGKSLNALPLNQLLVPHDAHNDAAVPFLTVDTERQRLITNSRQDIVYRKGNI